MNFIKSIAEIIANAANLNIDEVENSIEIPKQGMGDYAFPCFKLAKIMKKAPQVIAAEIADKINRPDYIEDIKVLNAYINFFVKKSVFVKNILENVNEKGKEYINSDIGNGKTIVIDYSSPNIAKPFHIGHLRSTAIGNSLYKIYKALGYKVVGINHLGDWGTQFGKLIVAYKLWGNKEAVEKDDIKELSRIYVKFHEEAEENPKLNDDAREWLVKMQKGDEEALSLWKWFCEISMKEFNRIYDRLGITFDSYAGESFYNDKMAAVVDEIKEKNLLTESQGAQIVNLDEYNMPPCLILRSDGGTLYPTRDISAAIYRKNTYNFDKCIYVTALDQNLHFAQWFKVIELMGYDWAKDLIHTPFGLVSLGDGKLSTRKGHVVLMEDILNMSVEKTKNIIEEKNPDLENKEKVAEEVGIGAIIFDDLFNSRIKNVVFDFDRMLNFDGETGPYAQYTHARACSIIKKAGEKVLSDNIDYNLLSDNASFNICKVISEFPEKVIEAADKNEPYIIARQIIEVCKAFNKFYNENNIMNSEESIKNARLVIVYAVKNLLEAGLDLLGIKAPEQM